MDHRVALWERHTVAKNKHQRAFRVAGFLAVALALVYLCIASYRGKWWPTLLDWVVIVIPTVAGFVAWAMPVKETTNRHRIWTFVGGVALSSLIYIQQWETRRSHEQEIAKLATKEDIAKLPTVQQIGLEFRKAAEEQTQPNFGNTARSFNTHAHSEVAQKQSADNVTPSDKIAKGIDDIKHMLGSQQWGLSADQLVRLSRMMAPYAELVNSWTGDGDLITSILANPDSNKFSTALIATLRSAGWNLPGSGMTVAMFDNNPEGIVFVLHSKDDANLPVLNAFAGLLKESSIPFHGELRGDVPTGQFRIIVGAKPN